MHLLLIQYSPKQPARAIDGQRPAGRFTCMFNASQQWPTTPRSNRRVTGVSPWDPGYAQLTVRPPQSDLGGGRAGPADTQQARLWPRTSRRPSTVSPSVRPWDHVTAVPVGVANDAGQPTGEVLEDVSALPAGVQQASARVRAGMLGTVVDTPGRGGGLQQRVQQRGPDELVPGRTTADAAGLWPAQTA